MVRESLCRIGQLIMGEGRPIREIMTTVLILLFKMEIIEIAESESISWIVSFKHIFNAK